jgi:hypothetical protein
MPKTTPYRLKFADKGAYLFVEARGGFPLPDVIIDLWTEIARECEKAGHVRLLYVDGFSERATLEAIRCLVDSPVAGLFRNLAVAVVSDRNRLENEFGVYLAQQKGINVRFFYSTNDAEEWLSGQPPQPQ